MAKGPDAFRTISEAADELSVPQHVLRFWETKFSFIRPMKRAGGRRFYRPQDIEVLRGVKTLLHGEGYTIKGVQRLHKEEGVRRLIAAGDEAAAGSRSTGRAEIPRSETPRIAPPRLSDQDRMRLSGALDELLAVKARLDALLER